MFAKLAEDSSLMQGMEGVLADMEKNLTNLQIGGKFQDLGMKHLNCQESYAFDETLQLMEDQLDLVDKLIESCVAVNDKCVGTIYMAQIDMENGESTNNK